MAIEVGQLVPEFSVADQSGELVTNKSILGQKTVLYFYPKDNTPGCTAQACNLRDNFELLKKQGYQIYGISSDSAEAHFKFIQKFELPFPLLVDDQQTMQKAFEVWGEKNMYGRKYMGTIRTTFIIDEDGRIAEIIRKVKTKDHSNQILK